MIARRPPALVAATLLLAACGSESKPPADSDTAADALAPITAATARALGAYARQMRTVSQGVGPKPVAWSMVNVSCQDRAMALEYVIASAPSPLPAQPPVVIDTDLTETKILDVAAHPSYPVATMDVAGPLVTWQTFVLPDGTTAAGDPNFYYWSIHHGVVLNVAGELRVLDLSLGDDLVPIAQWLSGFVQPGTECPLVTEDEYMRIMIHWNSLFGNLPAPEPPPEHLCGYMITPMFAFRSDQTPQDLASLIGFVPLTMQTQTGSLLTTLSHNCGVTVPEADAANVTSRYQPGVVAQICERVWMDVLCGEPPDGSSPDARIRTH